MNIAIPRPIGTDGEPVAAALLEGCALPSGRYVVRSLR